MALFSLTDIKFKKTISRTGTATLTPASDFRNDILKYPIDLGNVDKGHYMIFSINANDLTNELRQCVPQIPFTTQTSGSNFTLGQASTAIKEKFSSTALGAAGIRGLERTIPEQYRNLFGNISAAAFEKLAQLEIGRLTEQNFARRVTRIADTIALYMPNTLQFTQQQNYDKNVSRNDLLTGSIAAGTVALDSKNIVEMTRNLSPFLMQAIKGPVINTIGNAGTIQSIFAQAFGTVNPRLEVLYTSPQFRNFQFDFMFYPRSEAEALGVQRIIRKLKFHQAPEIKKGTANQFLVPPSDFNIEFYYNGKVNNNIPKIKGPCILDSINVDYAPDGFRAYESYDESTDNLTPSLGKTGMPVGIRMTLSFTEIEFMTKDAYRQEDDV